MPRKIQMTEGGKMAEDGMVLFYSTMDELYVKTSYHQEPIQFKNFTPMVRLYSSLICGAEPDVTEFRIHYQKTKIDSAQPICEKEFARVVNARISIFKSMKRALECDYDFFLRHPIEVSDSDEVNGFVIVDGLNRASFLKASGMNYFPCKASKSSFSKIKNGIVLEKTR